MDDLRKRLAAGQQAAFAELYDLYGARLYRYLTVRLGRAQDAADVLQELFVRLAQSRKQFLHVERDLTAYVFAVARNEATRLQAKRERDAKGRSAIAKVRSAEDCFEHAADTVDAAEYALRGLTDAQREVVMLKIYGGLTFQEIAQAIGSPQGTVATRYRDALERMRSRLTKSER